jgi:hypothetical protein
VSASQPLTGPHPDCAMRRPHGWHVLTGGKPTEDKTCLGRADISDAQLRAEVERRGLVYGSDVRWTVDR